MKIHPTTEIEKWRSVFKNYGAVLDLPAILFYKELMAVFPNAKVILTLREPKSWYKSWHNSIALQLEELKKNKIDRICRAVRLNRLVTLIYFSIIFNFYYSRTMAAKQWQCRTFKMCGFLWLTPDSCIGVFFVG